MAVDVVLLRVECVAGIVIFVDVVISMSWVDCIDGSDGNGRVQIKL